MSVQLRIGDGMLRQDPGVGCRVGTQQCQALGVDRALLDGRAVAYERVDPVVVLKAVAGDLRGKNGPAAANEFRKFLDHPGIVQNFALGSLARLQLARAYNLSGNPAKAKATYEDFFSLWKDADADVPILKEAKAEYAKLQ